MRDFLRVWRWLCGLLAGDTAIPAAGADTSTCSRSARCPSPTVPAQTWIVADMDTGQVLAARDENIRTHRPAPSRCCWHWWSSTSCSLDSTVVADDADTQVECNCVGVEARPHLHRAPTARRPAAGVGQRRRQHAGAHAGRPGRGGGQDERQGRARSARSNTHASTARPAWTVPADRAGPRRTIWRSSSARRWPTRCSRRSPPSRRRCSPAKTGDQPIVNQDELLPRYPGAIGGKTGFTDAGPQDVRRRRRSRRPPPGGRHDVRAGPRGRADLLGSGRQPARLGFRAGPRFQRRHALDTRLRPRRTPARGTSRTPR